MQTLIIVVPDEVNLDKLTKEIDFLVRRHAITINLKHEANKLEKEARVNSLVHFCNTGKFLSTDNATLKDLL